MRPKRGLARHRLALIRLYGAVEHCAYCGAYAPNVGVCHRHRDLPLLDPHFTIPLDRSRGYLGQSASHAE